MLWLAQWLGEAFAHSLVIAFRLDLAFIGLSAMWILYADLCLVYRVSTMNLHPYLTERRNFRPS
jgi:hypothetical protein